LRNSIHHGGKRSTVAPNIASHQSHRSFGEARAGDKKVKL
jgi:hypothetical protein